MSSEASITALVTERPSFLQAPTFSSPRAQLHFLVDHFQDQWENFIQYLEHEKHYSTQAGNHLRKQQLEKLNDDGGVLLRLVNEWMDFRMPTFYRTFAGLCEIRDRLNAPRSSRSFEFRLVQILWPKVTGSTDRVAEEATKLGVEVIPLDASSGGTFNYPLYLAKTKGQFLWIVPGGLKLNLFTFVARSFEQIIGSFAQQPEMAAFYDRHSTVWRVSAMKRILERRGSLPSNRDNAVKVLEEEGFLFTGHPYAEPEVTSIEKMYVRGSRPEPPSTPSWWEKISGKK